LDRMTAPEAPKGSGSKMDINEILGYALVKDILAGSSKGNGGNSMQDWLVMKEIFSSGKSGDEKMSEWMKWLNEKEARAEEREKELRADIMGMRKDQDMAVLENELVSVTEKANKLAEMYEKTRDELEKVKEHGYAPRGSGKGIESLDDLPVKDIPKLQKLTNELHLSRPGTDEERHWELAKEAQKAESDMRSKMIDKGSDTATELLRSIDKKTDMVGEAILSEVKATKDIQRMAAARQLGFQMPPQMDLGPPGPQPQPQPAPQPAPMVPPHASQYGIGQRVNPSDMPGPLDEATRDRIRRQMEPEGGA
jgi:hypothetical protein